MDTYYLKKISQLNLIKPFYLVKFNYLNFLQKNFPSLKILSSLRDFYLYITIKDFEKFIYFLKFQTNTQFKSLMDICAIEYITSKSPLELFYSFLSLIYNIRLSVLIKFQNTQTLKSLTFLYKAANWYEREVWDFFGILFWTHSDLRRILTDYGFKGHPLRKTFPLSGYIETFYNNFFKKMDYQEVSLSQIYRVFNLNFA